MSPAKTKVFSFDVKALFNGNLDFFLTTVYDTTNPLISLGMVRTNATRTNSEDE